MICCDCRVDTSELDGDSSVRLSKPLIIDASNVVGSFAKSGDDAAPTARGAEVRSRLRSLSREGLAWQNPANGSSLSGVSSPPSAHTYRRPSTKVRRSRPLSTPPKKKFGTAGLTPAQSLFFPLLSSLLVSSASTSNPSHPDNEVVLSSTQLAHIPKKNILPSHHA